MSLRRLRSTRAGTSIAELAEIARFGACGVWQKGRLSGCCTSCSLLYARHSIVAVGLFFLQQLSGINAVIYYAPEIFNQSRLRRRIRLRAWPPWASAW